MTRAGGVPPSGAISDRDARTKVGKPDREGALEGRPATTGPPIWLLQVKQRSLRVRRLQAHTEVFVATCANRRLLGVGPCCREHEAVEEIGERIMGVQREYVGDILAEASGNDADAP